MAGCKPGLLWRHFAVAALCAATAGGPLLAQESDPALQGAIDLHAHLDPDGFGPGNNGRGYDVLEMAEMARAAGMRGFVIKQHYDQSADSAYLVRELYPELDVFGGIGTNFATGGLNPAAIRQMAEVKGGWGRIVWMPTWDAKFYVENHGNDRPFIVVAESGVLTQAARDVIATIAQVNGHTRGSGGKVVMATGHNAPEEVLLMTAEARRLGVDVLITHPLLESVGMNMEQMRRAVEMGAYLEFVSAFADAEATIEEHVQVIRAIGPEHCIISSDRGQGRGLEGHDDVAALTPHTVGLARAAQALRAHGFTEAELALMFKDNPARLLGLPLR